MPTLATVKMFCSFMCGWFLMDALARVSIHNHIYDPATMDYWHAATSIILAVGSVSLARFASRFSNKIF